MLSPQQILEDYLLDNYLTQNTSLIFPVYKKIFNSLVSDSFKLPNDLISFVKSVNNYFNYVVELAKDNKLLLVDDKKDGIVVGNLVKLISKDMINTASSSMIKIINFIKENRTNINNLEFFSWTFFGETRREDIVKKYDSNLEEINNAFINPTFLILLLKYPKFGELILQDLLYPVELKSPTRMKGDFANMIFEIVFAQLSSSISNLDYQENTSREKLANLEYWYIIEKTTSSLSFPQPKPTSKRIDMVCKIKNNLFICSHKEQKGGGGAQDNQAIDVSSIYEYDDGVLDKIKKDYNVSEIFLCGLVESSSKVLSSVHWKTIFSIIKDSNNKNKYLLNSALFIKLIQSI